MSHNPPHPERPVSETVSRERMRATLRKAREDRKETDAIMGNTWNSVIKTAFVCLVLASWPAGCAAVKIAKVNAAKEITIACMQGRYAMDCSVKD